jgi:hypothetical protein
VKVKLSMGFFSGKLVQKNCFNRANLCCITNARVIFKTEISERVSLAINVLLLAIFPRVQKIKFYMQISTPPFLKIMNLK